MKKFLPFVFPLIALLIVIFLAVRWYNTNTTRTSDQLPGFGDNMTVEELPVSEQDTMRQAAKDVKTTELKGTSAQGQIRYEIKDGKLNLTVSGELPNLPNGVYQVWLKQVDGAGKKKLVTLTEQKGGYMGSASLSNITLPIDVVITKEMQNDEEMELVLMTGTIPAESTR